jgi:hypothetical protein
VGTVLKIAKTITMLLLLNNLAMRVNLEYNTKLKSRSALQCFHGPATERNHCDAIVFHLNHLPIQDSFVEASIVENTGAVAEWTCAGATVAAWKSAGAVVGAVVVAAETFVAGEFAGNRSAAVVVVVVAAAAAAGAAGVAGVAAPQIL